MKMILPYDPHKLGILGMSLSTTTKYTRKLAYTSNSTQCHLRFSWSSKRVLKPRKLNFYVFALRIETTDDYNEKNLGKLLLSLWYCNATTRFSAAAILHLSKQQFQSCKQSFSSRMSCMKGALLSQHIWCYTRIFKSDLCLDLVEFF